MKLVPVGDRWSKVDDAVYEDCMAFVWCLKARSDSKGFYAFRYIRLGTRKYRRELLHHFLLQPEPGIRVDHEDGDGLNNQRRNLRFATQQQNCFNQKKRRRASSKYTGVIKAGLIHGRWMPNKKWRARIRHNGRLIELGHFKTQREAAQVYNKRALELFGEFARVNEL